MSDLRTTPRNELLAFRDELAAKLSAIEVDIEGIKSEMAARLAGHQAAAQSCRSDLGQVTSEISRREATDAIVPTISDHALLRYIERICGVDIDALKAELLTDAVVLAIKAGASAVRSPAGTMVIKNSTVVTFLEAEARGKKKPSRGPRHVEDDFDEVSA